MSKSQTGIRINYYKCSLFISKFSALIYNMWKFDKVIKLWLAVWHIDMLIRHTICESLVKIEYWRHEYSVWQLLNAKNQGTCHNF